MQEGHRDQRIDALRYAARTEAAHLWIIRGGRLTGLRPIPKIHPVYKDVGQVFEFVEDATDAFNRRLVPVYRIPWGFIAVPESRRLLLHGQQR